MNFKVVGNSWRLFYKLNMSVIERVINARLQQIYGRKRAGLCHSIFAREHCYLPSGGGQTGGILTGVCSLVYMFQAPKQTDIKQGKKVELLYQQGYAYHSCGCGGPGYRPSRLSEVPEFLEIQRTFENKREALLYRLLQS
jgi:hypothetical protein